MFASPCKTKTRACAINSFFFIIYTNNIIFVMNAEAVYKKTISHV